MPTPCPSSELRLLRLLRDGRWHSLPAIVRAIRSYRVSSAVYRLKKMGFRCEWRPVRKNGDGKFVYTEYRLVS